MRSVTHDRTFLLQLRSWGVCEADVVWRLRGIYNRQHPEHKLWLLLMYWPTAQVP